MNPISVFDIFKIGIGPSSSHTLGPWKAALDFLKLLEENDWLYSVSSIEILLYGSLAKTGKGHGTDIAIQLGLSGEDPVTFDSALITERLEAIQSNRRITLNKKRELQFNPAHDIKFLISESLPFHPNALRFQVVLENGEQCTETYYSVGGGFVEKENDTSSHQFANNKTQQGSIIDSAAALLHWSQVTGKKISSLVLLNEANWRSYKETKSGLLEIWNVMKNSIYRGCHTHGTLPGGLNVKRRAADLNSNLLKGHSYNSYEDWIRAIRSGGNDFSSTLDWISCFALAVNEENASFGRVVTAPTNGAAGVIPAIIQYMIAFCNSDEEKIIDFLLTAAAIGMLFKIGATISAAMGGCQAEIGVSSAMAAAGLTEVMGGTPSQVLMAAEIAMEHHLGLTCDPVGGLVQIPCIERNTMGATKAIIASQLALQSSPKDAKVSLDDVIKTMWNTALDMNSKYKETADGGLAVSIPISLSEC